MKKRYGLVLGTAILMGGWACFAQETPIPFNQLHWNTESSARPVALGPVLAITSPSGPTSSVSASASPAVIASATGGIVRVPTATDWSILGAKYFLLNGLQLGLTGLDVALTQHCIAEHHCQEGNPLLPSSLLGRISVEFTLVSLSAFASGRLKKQGSKHWWIPPAVGIAAHGVGIATGLAHE